MMRSVPPVPRAALMCLAIVVLAAAALFSIRLAWADIEFRLATEESVQKALRILPGNVQYRLFRALQLDYAGADSTAELMRAAALSPMSAAPRIRLGLAAEAKGDAGTAEKWLLDAAGVDHQFEPRWTLANFYFRQQRRDEFWKWMHAALEVSYGDRRPAFDLCWRFGKNADEILERAVPEQGAPAQRDVLAAMLIYALDQHREDAGKIAMELAKVRDPGDIPLLDAACGALIESGDADSAAHLWIAAGHTPAGGVWNGSFAAAPSNAGFDWRLDRPPGIAQVQVGRGRRIEFSGKQPEASRLLWQMALLDPARRYRLEWKSRTDGLSEMTGVEWKLGAQKFPVSGSTDWKTGSAPARISQRLVPLELWYQRPSGQVRAEGWIEIRDVALVPID